MFGRSIALICGLVALAAAPASASAVIVGLQDDQLHNMTVSQIDRRVDMVAATGVRWTRVDVMWKQIAPTQPTAPADPGDPAYRWDHLDAIVAGFALRGIRPILNVYWGPAWANGGHDEPQWAPDRYQYGAFMVALGKRYSGRYVTDDGTRLPRVTHFELWNEPNLDLFFRPQWIRTAGGGWAMASPRRYAEMVRTTHTFMRRARPDALLIVGALAPTNVSRPGGQSIGVREFIQAMVRERIPVMAASQHIYPGAAPGRSRALPSEYGVQQIRRLWSPLKRNVPLYITETGYTTAYTPYRRYQITPAQQVTYLPQLLRNLAQPGVPMVIWFNLEDNALWPAGLHVAGGDRKPAWPVFRRTVEELRRR